MPMLIPTSLFMKSLFHDMVSMFLKRKPIINLQVDNAGSTRINGLWMIKVIADVWNQKLG